MLDRRAEVFGGLKMKYLMIGNYVKKLRFRGGVDIPWEYFRKNAGLRDSGDVFDVHYKALVNAGAISEKKGAGLLQ
ncbi:MAG: hypothetical protein HYW25_05085 [Candidatus Aenigmarchaeota archaeon]|nr:hypothetical protein [Candidatus Aenigmarchaeota archaeon]